jgi:hypothetical protein
VPNDIATIATWSINSASQGNKKIRRLTSASTSSDGSVTAINELGSSVPVGFEIAPGGHTISLELRETKGARPEIDWHKLEETKEVFSLTRQVKEGRRQQFPECMVSKIDDEVEAEGKLTFSVEIIALQRKRM